MLHLDVNWIAILLATVASMALGMVYYMGLGKQWVAATGKKESELMAGGSATPFIWAAICQLVMAFFLIKLTEIIFAGVIDVRGAVIVGVHMWLGFIMTSMVLNHRYQGHSWKLTLIDGGYLLGVMVVQGVVIGLFG